MKNKEKQVVGGDERSEQAHAGNLLAGFEIEGVPDAAARGS